MLGIAMEFHRVNCERTPRIGLQCNVLSQNNAKLYGMSDTK